MKRVGIALWLLLFVDVVFATGSPLTPYTVFNAVKRTQSTVFEDRNYHHAPSVTEFNKRIYVAWNGNLYNSNEGQPGQVILLRSSDDGGKTWGDVQIPFVREYRALDEATGKGVDARPGSADEDHRIRLTAARQWQPALVSFANKLLMFWGQDRGQPGSALMMSVLEPETGQWRSHELHFKQNNSPYMIAVKAGGKDLDQVTDPTYLSIGTATDAAPRDIGNGLARIPKDIRIADWIETTTTSRKNSSRAGKVDSASLSGQRLVPSPNYAVAFSSRVGGDLLAVAVVLQQVEGDWNNEALKIPATLTTRDLVTWHLSTVPLGKNEQDFLADPRGSVGWISAWEPSVTMDDRGAFGMLFRLNLPPRRGDGQPARSAGFRMAHSIGAMQDSGAIAWSVPKLLDLDVAVSRGQVLRRGKLDRWVLIDNNDVQGVKYRANGTPEFPAEQYDPWARSNLSLFFSTRGTNDYVSGLNLSAGVETPGVELVHYPSAQSVTGTNGKDEILLAYSTHRRIPACFQKKGTISIESCHDSIQFARLGGLPDPDGAYVYPNHFAKYFEFGASKSQDKTYGYHDGMLTLFGRGSAGVDTFGDKGCINVRFKMEGNVGKGMSRPVVSFARTADRSRAIGLAVEQDGARQVLSLMGKRLPTEVKAGQWSSTQVCYDVKHMTVSSGDVVVAVRDAMAPRAYLGDPTLARVPTKFPDITFDVNAMSVTRSTSRN